MKKQTLVLMLSELVAIVMILLAFVLAYQASILTVGFVGPKLCETIKQTDTLNLHNLQNGNYIFAFVEKDKGNILYMEIDATGKPVETSRISSAKFLDSIRGDLVGRGEWALSCPAAQVKQAVVCKSSTVVWSLRGKTGTKRTDDLWMMLSNVMPRELCEEQQP